MDKTGVPQERLLYASYSPPHLYEDETDDGQPIVTALFQEPTESGGVAYAIREYSLVKGDILPFPQKRQAFGPGGEKAGVVQGDQDALTGLGFRGRGQRFLRGVISPQVHQTG